MRNLKRALSLALAAVMVLSMMVIGAGAVNLDDFSDKDEIVNKEAVTVLTTLNVINGKDDGSYDPTGIVTRAEMAKIICVILNGGSDPALGASTTHTYTDTVNHWAEAYIEYCTQLGIVAGKGNGTFDPNGTVTATEAAKMLLVALGYNAGFENMVGANWAVSTNVLANQNKLYAGLDIDVDAGLTRDNAAQMAYNALNCEMVAYTYALVTGADGSLTSIPRVEKKDDTLLSDKFGGVRVEGVVVRNEQTASSFDGKTRIDITNEDELTKVGHNFGDAATFEVSTDASLLGTSVFFYVVPSVASPKNSEKAVVLGNVMDSGKNTVVTTTKTFGSDGVKGFMKDNDVTVNSDTVLYVDGAVSSTAVSALVNQTGNEVKFIDNDNDGITEAVVQTNYGFGKVTKYSTKDDGSLTIDTYADSKDYKSAKIVGFGDVALDDYVVYNVMGGKLYVAKAETVTGKLETYKANNDRLKANLTVDGTAYTFSQSCAYNKDGKLDLPETYLDNSYMGKEITLYMDKFGYVAATSEVQGFTDYAYIANASSNNDASGLAGSVRVYAVLADGTEASYVVNDLDKKSCTGVTGADTPGSNPVTIGNVYGYYVNSDGKIDLTSVNNTSAVAGNTQNITYDKGDSTISATGLNPKLVNSNTVFFYVMKEVNASGDVTATVKSVETYIGKDNAPSVKVQTTDGGAANTLVRAIPSRDDASIAGAVVFEVGQVTSANVLYLYQYVKSTGENAIYNAVIDGKLVEGITVDSKLTNLSGAYTYTITSKGYYNLNTISTGLQTDFVKLADGKTVVLDNGTEVKITASTSMAEIDGSDTAIITGVTKKDYVTVVYNTNTMEALGIYITEPYSTDNASILNVGGILSKSSTSGFDYDVANGKTAGAVVSALTTSKDATAYVTYTKPATLAEAVKAENAIASGTTLNNDVKAYIVVVSKDETAYSVATLKVGDGSGSGATDPEEPTDPTETTVTLNGYSTSDYKFYVNNVEATATSIRGGVTVAAKTGDKLVIENSSWTANDVYTVGDGKVYTVDPSKGIEVTVTKDMVLSAPVKQVALHLNGISATYGDATAIEKDSVTYVPSGTTVTLSGVTNAIAVNSASNRINGSKYSATTISAETWFYEAFQIASQTSASNATFGTSKDTPNNITAGTTYVAKDTTVYIQASENNKAITATGTGAPELTEVTAPDSGTKGIYSFTITGAVKADAFTQAN